jgi:hypothetical protein
VGAKSIFSAKSVFSASFNAILRHLEMSQEANFWLVLIQSIPNTNPRKKKEKKFWCPKYRTIWKNFAVFGALFLGQR